MVRKGGEKVNAFLWAGGDWPPMNEITDAKSHNDFVIEMVLSISFLSPGSDIGSVRSSWMHSPESIKCQMEL
jgi:hypothetical protein